LSDAPTPPPDGGVGPGLFVGSDDGGDAAVATRAARWATVQVGRHGRTVAEVADDLDCDWHTVMDAVVVYGKPLIGIRALLYAGRPNWTLLDNVTPP
jgi:hypothetical protein